MRTRRHRRDFPEAAVANFRESIQKVILGMSSALVHGLRDVERMAVGKLRVLEGIIQRLLPSQIAWKLEVVRLRKSVRTSQNGSTTDAAMAFVTQRLLRRGTCKTSRPLRRADAVPKGPPPSTDRVSGHSAPSCIHASQQRCQPSVHENFPGRRRSVGRASIRLRLPFAA